MSNRALIDNLDPDEWDLPPKPKWMRWCTYTRLVEKFDAYKETVDQQISGLQLRALGC
jgi:hypothetical protein